MVTEVISRLFRSIFREQKVRLQVEWLTHTDELIMERLDAGGPAAPNALAEELDRSQEYIADRCRQLVSNGLLERVDETSDQEVGYALAAFGDRYLAGDVSADELELDQD